MIHELGHFTAAKIFKVYVQDFSIGFGPAFFHKKRKNGETYFSLRVVPFGGFVSMYGEGVELPDGVQVDESRSLEGIKKWKRAIILVAGVTMNAVLALHIFFIYNVSFTNTVCYYNVASVKENSIAYNAGIKTGDMMALDSYISDNKDDYSDTLHLVDKDSFVTKTDDSVIDVYTYFDLSGIKDYKEETLKLSNHLVFYCATEVDGQKAVDKNKPLSIDVSFKSVSFQIATGLRNEETNKVDITKHQVVVEKAVGEKGFKLDDFGYSLYLDVQKPLPFFKAIGQSFVDFGNSATVIVRALGTLFSKTTWDSMGGIVAIGFQTTSVLQNFGFGKFLYIWGVLSVNLAIVNLIPFPGLDGWQLLVLGVEAIAHKKIPEKVKNIVSIVGIALLFIFMIVLIFKDVFTYIL